MLTIIGCGNSNRSDDGVGVSVAQALQHTLRLRPCPDVRVFDAGTGGMDVMFQARGASSLVVFDAVTSGAPAGTTYRVPGAELALPHARDLSLHDFRWDHALHAGRQIFGADFPADVSVYLIEAADLALGLGLSAPVQSAAKRVISELERRIDDQRQ